MKPALTLFLISGLLATSLHAEPAVLKARASEIDPRAKEHPELNFVFADAKGKPKDLQVSTVDLSVKSEGKLVIWLMGYRAELFERCASYGYHAIQPHYANGWFSSISKKVGTGTGIGGVRLEAATGEDHSPLVEIPKPDGMQERALQFVKWLSKEQPKAKWEQFINAKGDELIWEKVIIAGSSHGSTTSARFAKHKKVSRVVMFCGPRDQYETWQSLDSVTPTNRYFAFTHVLDGGWTGDHYCRSWQMLGLHEHGPIVNVDATPAPFKNSRRLVTDFDVKKDAKKAHSMVTPGGASGKNKDGSFAHESVWKYLFTHPVEATGEAVPVDPDCRMDLR